MMNKLIKLATIDNIQKVAINKDYKVFKSSTKPYNLNLWMVRNNDRVSGTFNDLGIVFWRYSEQWQCYYFDITTDPSTHYLFNGLRKGTAIVKPDQYPGWFKLGYHKGKYKALVQARPITVIRDFNKDNILDWNVPKRFPDKRYRTNTGSVIEEWMENNKVICRTETGMFGINYHRASLYHILRKIGLYSAGCMVHQDAQKYLKEFIPTIEQSIKHGWKNSFTGTLITENDLLKVA